MVITETAALYEFLPKNAIGAELGVCKGDNAQQLYKITKPQKLYLVDIWIKDETTYKYHPPELYYDDWYELVKSKFPYDNVKVLKMNTLDFLESLEDESLDWVYLDSDHMYSHFSKEIALSIKKVKKGGCVAGHDFVVNSPWNSSVIRGVIEHIQTGELTMTHISPWQFASYLCVKN